MSSLNKVILLGNLGRDPEVKATANGGKLVNLSIATSERWRDKQSGERKERTEWHRVVVFNDKIVDVIDKHVRKGSRVLVEGQLRTRKWQAQDGSDRYSTEVVLPQYGGNLVLLGGNRPEGSEDEAPAPTPKPQAAAKEAPLDDDIPF
jgi:single-strand DNA-binding protein